MNFKVVGFKMPQELSDRIDECVAHLGVQRTAWVREVLAAALKKEGFPVDPSILKPNQGARNDLPNRITEAEKRSRKGTRPRGRPRKTLPVPPIPPARNVRINPDGSFSPVSAPPEAPPSHRHSAA